MFHHSLMIIGTVCAVFHKHIFAHRYCHGLGDILHQRIRSSWGSRRTVWSRHAPSVVEQVRCLLNISYKFDILTYLDLQADIPSCCCGISNLDWRKRTGADQAKASGNVAVLILPVVMYNDGPRIYAPLPSDAWRWIRRRYTDPASMLY